MAAAAEALKTSPLARVKEEFGGKDKLVDKIVGVLDSGDESKDELRKRLLGVSNTKLIRLFSVATKTKQAGGHDKLVATTAEKLKRGKDKDYVAKLDELLERSPAGRAVGGRAPQRCGRGQDRRRRQGRARQGRRESPSPGAPKAKAAAKPEKSAQGQEVGGGGEVRAREGQQAVARQCSWAGSWGGSGRRGRRLASPVASCCSCGPRPPTGREADRLIVAVDGLAAGPGDRVRGRARQPRPRSDRRRRRRRQGHRHRHRRRPRAEGAMILGRVIGHVWAARRDARLQRAKLLVIRPHAIYEPALRDAAPGRDRRRRRGRGRRRDRLPGRAGARVRGRQRHAGRRGGAGRRRSRRLAAPTRWQAPGAAPGIKRAARRRGRASAGK